MDSLRLRSSGCIRGRLLFVSLLCTEASGLRPDQSIENRWYEYQNPQSDPIRDHLWKNERQHAADGKIDRVLNNKPAPRKSLSPGFRPEGVAGMTQVTSDRGRQKGRRIRRP